MSPSNGMPVPASGEQVEIVSGSQRATVVEVGGVVRAYREGDRDVLEPYDVERMSDGAHGAVLVPWPNRVEDGSYDFDGVSHQLSLTEPKMWTAIHGLLK